MEAAHSAKLAIGLARDSMNLELRPYIAVETVNMRHVLDAQGRVVERWLQIEWENVGNTPATHLMVTANCLVSDGSLPDDFAFPERPGRNEGGALGREKKVWSNAPSIPLNEWQLVLDGKKVLHLWGIARYQGSTSTERFETKYYVTITLWNSQEADDPGINFTTWIGAMFNEYITLTPTLTS
ncbi:hypothetical protein [Sphingomonas sp. ID0503]|uniref:hypothetical protein n=1 Tax=Sphingomonas sp. ID0503 TaxID=3399691 RepID=UPI003AFB07FC